MFYSALPEQREEHQHNACRPAVRSPVDILMLVREAVNCLIIVYQRYEMQRIRSRYESFATSSGPLRSTQGQNNDSFGPNTFPMLHRAHVVVEVPELQDTTEVLETCALFMVSGDSVTIHLFLSPRLNIMRTKRVSSRPKKMIVARP
jgi:hypothetical protein